MRDHEVNAPADWSNNGLDTQDLVAILENWSDN